MTFAEKLVEQEKLTSEITEKIQGLVEWLSELKLSQELDLEYHKFQIGFDEKVESWEYDSTHILVKLHYLACWDDCGDSFSNIKFPFEWVDMKKGEVLPLAVDEMIVFDKQCRDREVERVRSQAIELGLIKEEGMTIYEILEAVAATTKKNEKEGILKQHQNNETLKRCFYLAYAPTVQFYIKKIPDGWQHTDLMSTRWESVFEFLELLSSRQVTGNAALEELTNTLNVTDYKVADVVCRIIKKDLRCGVGKQTINKIWKGLIVTPHDKELKVVVTKI